jgi:DNA-binding CsgD family transcriptional regulator
MSDLLDIAEIIGRRTSIALKVDEVLAACNRLMSSEWALIWALYPNHSRHSGFGTSFLAGAVAGRAGAIPLELVISDTRSKLLTQRVFIPLAFQTHFQPFGAVKAKATHWSSYGLKLAHESCSASLHEPTYLLTTFRARRQPGFSTRDRALIKLVARAFMHGHQYSIPYLAPRLAQVLDELLLGRSEKECARRLNLSAHTVHDYVKTLHKRFQVSTRAELMVACFRGRESDLRSSLSHNQDNSPRLDQSEPIRAFLHPPGRSYRHKELTPSLLYRRLLRHPR